MPSDSQPTTILTITATMWPTKTMTSKLIAFHWRFCGNRRVTRKLQLMLFSFMDCTVCTFGNSQCNFRFLLRSVVYCAHLCCIKTAPISELLCTCIECSTKIKKPFYQWVRQFSSHEWHDYIRPNCEFMQKGSQTHMRFWCNWNRTARCAPFVRMKLTSIPIGDRCASMEWNARWNKPGREQEKSQNGTPFDWMLQ